MTCSVELDLPFPISVNCMFPQNRRTGRRFASRAYRNWKADAGWAIKLARVKRIEHPVKIQITLTPPDRRRRDGDNLIKGLLDALVQNGVLDDDCNKHIRGTNWVWADEPDKARPRATIIITAAHVSAGGSKRSTMELAQS